VYTVDQLDSLVGEMSEEEQRRLVARIAQRLGDPDYRPPTMSPESFLQACRERPVAPYGTTDSADTLRGLREGRAGSL
jgi:hypothetical protein